MTNAHTTHTPAQNPSIPTGWWECVFSNGGPLFRRFEVGKLYPCLADDTDYPLYDPSITSYRIYPQTKVHKPMVGDWSPYWDKSAKDFCYEDSELKFKFHSRFNDIDEVLFTLPSFEVAEIPKKKAIHPADVTAQNTTPSMKPKKPSVADRIIANIMSMIPMDTKHPALRDKPIRFGSLVSNTDTDIAIDATVVTDTKNSDPVREPYYLEARGEKTAVLTYITMHAHVQEIAVFNHYDDAKEYIDVFNKRHT